MKLFLIVFSVMFSLILFKPQVKPKKVDLNIHNVTHIVCKHNVCSIVNREM